LEGEPKRRDAFDCMQTIWATSTGAKERKKVPYGTGYYKDKVKVIKGWSHLLFVTVDVSRGIDMVKTRGTKRKSPIT